MRAISLVLLLAASTLSAPQGDVEDKKVVKEVKEAVVEPESRSLLHAAIPYNAPGYRAEQTHFIVPQQFGARLVAPQQKYQQYNQYQPQYQSQYQPQYQYQSQYQPQYQSQYQPQYQSQYHGQAYYPAQSYEHNSPYYQSSAHNSGANYQGASGYYPQTFSTITATKKSAVVKPLVPVHHEVERFHSVVAAPVVRAHAAPVIKAADHTVKAANYPGHPEPYHVIVKQAHDDNFDGSFAYSYETDHGIAVESNGFLKNAGTPDQVQVMQGSYTYYTPEGIPITTTYIADENGFQVQGDHLPQPPEMPEAIAKSIAYQRSLPPSEEELVEQERAKLVEAKFYAKH